MSVTGNLKLMGVSICISWWEFLVEIRIIGVAGNWVKGDLSLRCGAQLPGKSWYWKAGVETVIAEYLVTGEIERILGRENR